MRSSLRIMATLGLALACQAAGFAAELSSGPAPAGPLPERIELPGIHNAFRVSDKVISGSQPENDEAFAALVKRGVRTIISVDGSKPDVEAAHRHGMRYVHLPFGYNSVPTNRIAELAKAATSAAGPIFVHCHHGLHRGPAAVAVICQATENWSTNQATVWLREAGTAPDYRGLYDSVATFQKPSREQLDAVSQLPEVAKTSSLVEAMVLIDEHFSRLKLCEEAGWKTPPNHADLAPAHEALMLLEQFQELTRTEDTTKRPADYREKLDESLTAALALRQSLVAGDSPATTKSFRRVGATCAACHRAYRN